MITDLVAMQENIYFRLMSWSRLNRVNFELERRMRVQVQQDPVSGAFVIDPDEVVMKSRVFPGAPEQPVGPVGLGAIVEMPKIRQSVSQGGAPEDIVAFPVVFLESPLVNFTPAAEGFGGGTFITAEEAARLGRRCLRRCFIRDRGEFYDDETPLRPVPDGEFPNLIGYRITLLMRMMDESIPLLSMPEMSIDGAFVVTLATPAEAADASIYYTLDGSFPGPGNPAAIAYGGPFQSQANAVICWAAYHPQFLPSDVDRATINP